MLAALARAGGQALARGAGPASAGFLAPAVLAARGYATQIGRSLMFSEHGVPEKVLRLEPEQLPALGDHEVLVNVLAAPINPSDINTIEGKYPLRPELPGVPGHEGVGVVEAVGPKVTRMRPGDRVVPIEHGQGTWRSHGVFNEQHWYKIPKDLPIAAAATMVVNPPTAVRLLEEFVPLEAGDTLVQNGATSAVGRYIIQLAKSRGVNTINIIRDRPDRAEVEADLKDLGATVVTTSNEIKAALKDSRLPKPKLALDCVSGDAAAACAKVLVNGGTMVTYGAMSQQPLTVPPGLLIFNDIRLRGFWLTGGYAKMKDGWRAKEDLVDRVVALFRTKVFRPGAVAAFDLEQWEEAMKQARSDHRNKTLLKSYDGDRPPA
ncbi:putative trans-2-enoyl- mitochondrial [Chlorella sorokiniana]|uniref:enoyl-[acyl-carrier-protein] reductase n=1 Tax=Chlorella sorokiniana TaxID=3076 RepID=A0A2P6TNE9_CHLSO|nr:putative trans-2-enoyl- mitochondrial [Chlorella sorokiniana]|eukprot:PRW50861.1 putative trans-2-enoyl- mitochondrial [Chlorella sorokiniana]